MLHATIANRRDSRVHPVLQPRVRPGRYDNASARRHLFARNGSQRSGRHERFGAGRINSGHSGTQRRHGHDCRSKHKQRRGGVLDLGDLANGNVRIARDLRRRRNDNRNHTGRPFGIVGNIELDGNLGDLGTVDIFRDAGNVRIDGNVRLRFEQHYRIVEPDIICHDERRHSRRNSVGILRDRQSRG